MPHFNNYISHKARNVYNVAIVETLSPFKTKLVQSTPGIDPSFILDRAPEFPHIEEDCMNDDGDEHEYCVLSEADDDDELLDCDDDCDKNNDGHGLEEFRIWRSQIPFDIVGVISESDSGLTTSENFVTFDCHMRGDDKDIARRDKFELVNRMKEFGLRTIEQALVRSQEEATDFAINSLNMSETRKVVVKPRHGVGSENVSFCTTEHSVRRAVKAILSSNVFGDENDENEKRHSSDVLVEEYAEGEEYAVDVVSRLGEHKIAAVWKYENKGRLYSATTLFKPTTPEEFELFQNLSQFVCEGMLDSCNVLWGMTHNEVKVNEAGEVLGIEVNARQHNTNFAPLTSCCVGYNQLDMVLSAYLSDVQLIEEGEENKNYKKDDGDEEDDDMTLVEGYFSWDKFPVLPNILQHANIIHLACGVTGIIKKVDSSVLCEIEQLESVVGVEIFADFQVGAEAVKTTDFKSDCGWVHQISDHKEVIEKDYAKILKLTKKLFIV